MNVSREQIVKIKYVNTHTHIYTVLILYPYLVCLIGLDYGRLPKNKRTSKLVCLC